MKKDPLKGRGAQYNISNPFNKHHYSYDEPTVIDEAIELGGKTEYILDHPKTIVNKVDSPDLGMMLSLNPYQGCEHGCIYCYARNSHQYWGYSAGIEFERKIIVKPNAPELLIKALNKKTWKVYPIMLSGNTDCYQPAEKKFKITQQLLKICNDYNQPVGIITKNSLIKRDIEILSELASKNLVTVNFSITSLNENLRRILEPRTASAKKKIEIIAAFTKRGIPINIMNAPIIPGLNDHEIPAILKSCSEAGALSAAYTIVRLNGSVGPLFEQWIKQHLPDKSDKVLSQIKAAHGGSLNDSQWGRRMKGEGPLVEAIHNLFKISKLKYFKGKVMPKLDCSKFRRPTNQLNLFP